MRGGENMDDQDQGQPSEQEHPYLVKMATCFAPNCKFSVLSQNEEEAVSVLQNHAKTYHNHEVPAEKIMAALETVQA